MTQVHVGSPQDVCVHSTPLKESIIRSQLNVGAHPRRAALINTPKDVVLPPPPLLKLTALDPASPLRR